MLLNLTSTTQRNAVLTCWNEWFPPDYVVDGRLLSQLTVDHPSWAGGTCSRLAMDGNELVAFLLARPHLGETVVDALAVKPEYRRRGLGSALVDSLGPGRLRFGGGPAHFVPGLPSDWNSAQEFFRSREFVPDWEAEDLHLELGERPKDFLSCQPQEHDSVLTMVAEEFSSRWTSDTQARFESGDTQDVILIREGEMPVAFCQTWHYKSHLLGPSVFWLRSRCAKFGGIGPVGVKASHRGRGLGYRVVEDALNYLAHRRVEEVVVDWTSIGPFYEKNGFRRWRTYRGFHRPASLGGATGG